MERWIAIILGLLVIVIGFIIVQNILDGQEGLVNSGNDFECTLNGGVCVENCQATTLSEYTCSENRECCLGGS